MEGALAITFPIVFNTSLEKVAYLDKAFNIGYEKNYNGLWTATLSLPGDDPKVDDLQTMYYLEIYDGDERVDLFRLRDREKIRSNQGYYYKYNLEHVLVTLMDSLLYRYHETGGTGTYTEDVIDYILAEQDTSNWTSGTISFTRQFQYSWENENLLAALLSVPKPFDSDYRWTWDTETHPWTINLLAADTTDGPQVRASRNMTGINYTEDSSNLCTRLYALGQGEGINQLGIEDSNPTGEAYIDADTIATYGTITRVWVDRRYEHHETLYNAAVAMLDDLSVPRVEVSVNAADLHKVTDSEVDKFYLGRAVKIVDADLGISYDSRVVKLAKADVKGQPYNIQIDIANRPQDVAGTIADLASRTRINQLYAQGATNMDSHQMADNCDGDNPIVVKFHLSTDAVHINKCLLNYDTGAFRAYSKGAASGGGTSTTTASGGGTTTSSGGGQTTSSGGGQTSSAGSDHSHSVSAKTSSSGGGHTHSNSTSTGSSDGSSGYHTHSITSPLTYTGGEHSHTIYAHTTSTEDDHKHTVSDHTHTVSSHTHSVSSHTHDITIDAHTHDITYGIYEGPTPTAVTVKVDGNTVSGLGLSEEEVDIMDYLDRDVSGKITRGFHEVEITPDDLGRINVVVHVQQFVQSKGSVRV